MECNGYHERCKCNDCEEANELYKELIYMEYLSKEDYKEEIKEVTNKLEGMGYSV